MERIPADSNDDFESPLWMRILVVVIAVAGFGVIAWMMFVM